MCNHFSTQTGEICKGQDYSDNNRDFLLTRGSIRGSRVCSPGGYYVPSGKKQWNALIYGQHPEYVWLPIIFIVLLVITVSTAIVAAQSCKNPYKYE